MRAQINYEEHQFWTPKEIAAALGLKTARPVNDAINRGELAAYEPFYNHRVVEAEDFRAWIDAKRVKPSVLNPLPALEETTMAVVKKLAKPKKVKATKVAQTLKPGQTLHSLA